MIKWAILLYGIGISGGANVIFNHAIYAQKHGVEITIISRVKGSPAAAAWHKDTEHFRFLTLEEAINESFDVAIATEWRSAYDIYMVDADKYIYFVQSIESKFYRDENSFMSFVSESTYNMPLNYITEAHWIKDYLLEKYNQEASLVLNGIDKDIFNETGATVSERIEGKVRILIEGSLKNWLKNVHHTIEICRKAGVEEIWLVTPDKVNTVQGVDRLFSQVSMSDMADIYRSCDVLVKLSLVEGMFGPPLEMFHCGGTAITYDISGADEYLINGQNAIVVKKNDENAVREALTLLLKNGEKLQYLQNNARKTAEEWLDWNESSKCFWECVNSLPKVYKEQLESIKFKGKQGAQIYRRIEKFIGMPVNNNRIGYLFERYKEAKKDVYIYGAGNFCKNTIILLSEYDIPIKGIIVSSLDDNPDTVLGHKVYEIKNMNSDSMEMYIYISTEQYYSEIKEMLIDCGYKDII